MDRIKQEQTLSDNELIAEFMGLKIEEYSKLWPNPTTFTFNRVPKPLYDESWDWLMPVVEKINNHDNYSCVHIDSDQVYLHLKGGTMDGFPFNKNIQGEMIKAVYTAVVRFMKWK